MSITNDNTSQSPETTPPDAVDVLLQAIADAAGVGEVRLYRHVGSLRQAVKAMEADAFDPFKIGEAFGPGKYFAQFVQRGRIIRSATFIAEGTAAPQQQTAPAIQTAPAPDSLMMLMMRGIMEQNAALLQGIANRDSSSLLERLLPLIQQQQQTPVAVYRQLLEMVDRRTAAEPAPSADGFTLGDVLKALPALFSANQQQPRPQAPALPAPTTPAPPIAPTPPQQPTPPPADVGAAQLQALEEQSGIPFTAIPRVLRFGSENGLSDQWAAETIAEKIDARPEQEAARIWRTVADADGESMIGALLHLFPELRAEEKYVNAVWATLRGIAADAVAEALNADDVPGQMLMTPPTVTPPQHAPQPKPTAKAKGPFKPKEEKQ